MSARKIQIPPPKSIVSHLWGGPGQWHSLSYGRGLDQFFVDGLYDTPDDLMAAMDRRTAQGYGCWFSAHPMTERPPQPDDGRIARGGAEHVGSVVAIPADFDWKHDGAHKATDLPTEAEVRALLHKVPVQPQIIINSGHGIQCWWVLETPVDADTGAALCQRWTDHLRDNYGLDNDRVDLASVLRVPGSVNFKIPDDPTPVVVEQFQFRKIRLTSFTNRIGDLSSAARRSTSGGGVDLRGLDDVCAKLRADGRDQDADALQVLCRHHNGHHPFIDAKGNVYATRPDKPSGISASVGYVGPGIVKVFTDNWKPFKKNERYVIGDTGDRLVNANENLTLDTTTTTTTTSTTTDTELVAGSEVFSGPDGYRYSDTGNAKRFLEQYGAHVRFVPRWGRWLVFDGGRWRIDYGDTLVAFLAGKIAVDLLGHVGEVRRDKDKLKALLRHVKRSESALGVVATLKVAASVPGVAIDHEVLDANPWLLNVANGTLDLTTGKIRDHDPADHLTMQATVEFAADAVADKFLTFLKQVLPDPDLRGFVQRLAGLALVGQQLEHVLPINLGNGANGKSTLTRIMAEVLGEYAVVASRDVLLALKHDTHPTAKADLFRRRFAHSGELPPGARLDEAQVKELTGGDRIKARRMREDHWEFDPSHLLWIHANHRPSIEGTDDGIWRRVLLIPFDVQVPESERDSRLAEKIVKNESAGVLNWMIDGLADYLENGLRVPEIVKVATKSYRNESDTVAAFLDESDLTVDPLLSITSGDLLAIHGDWYQSAGIGESEKAHYQRVVDDLKQHGVVLKRRGQKKTRTWLGVGETP